MKREDYNYTSEQAQKPTNMFPKFHNPNPNPNSNPAFHHPSPPHSPHPPSNALSIVPLPPPPSTDGATIEVVRRPRGRPPGSKNKPKPPVVINRDSSEPIMSPYVLELPPGVDIVDSAARFCRRRGIGLCVLSGNGVVTNVTLKQPSSTPGATVTFHGRFDILSISATILPVAGGLDPAGNGIFTLSLAGPQGQVVGGLVVGPLVAAGTIYLVAATFNNPSYHRLQLPDHDQDPDPPSAGDGGRDSPKTASGGDSAAAGAGPMYSYQASDVIWAPTPRQPQAPQPPQAPPY